ncbi:hypothetical protein J3A83DRAFT_2022720 [Scleroderma citrinum]
MSDWRAHLAAMFGALAQDTHIRINTLVTTMYNIDPSITGPYRTFLPIALQGVALFAVYRIFRWMHTRSARKSSPVASGNKVTTSKDITGVTLHQALDANRNRDPGAWTPEKFDYPEITPYPDALVDIRPIPYRPFRWGEYQCVPLSCSRCVQGRISVRMEPKQCNFARFAELERCRPH